MSGDYGYEPSIGFLRFCDDPELACCKAEKDYLRLKAQETGLYEKAMELEYEAEQLKKALRWAMEQINGSDQKKRYSADSVEKENPYRAWWAEYNKATELLGAAGNSEKINPELLEVE